MCNKELLVFYWVTTETHYLTLRPNNPHFSFVSFYVKLHPLSVLWRDAVEELLSDP